MNQRNAVNRFVTSLTSLVVLAVSVFSSCPLYAQVVGATLSGTVTDRTGAVISQAEVSIKNTATGIVRDVKPDSSGFYTAPNLLPGKYELTASAPGFSKQVQTDVNLTVGASQVVNISLEIGQLTQEVLVSSTAPAVQLATSTISGETNSETVTELPLNGRDWTQLATLQPGVITLRTQQPASVTSGRGNRGFGLEFAAAGHSPFQNNYRINGISVNDFSNGSPGSVLGAQLGVDAVQEFSILTANYSAEYGRTSGAVINAITKSGTNDLHGSAYWFLRDEDFDARNFFDPAQIPPFHRNEFGASGGGPIIKNKTFIYGNYEAIHQDQSLPFLDTVPTAAARSGSLCSAPTTGTCTPTQITVNPKVAPYLPFWPLPNAGLVPGGNGDVGFFSTVGSAVASENYGTARVDHRFSEKDSLSGSWFLDSSTYTQPDALLDGTFGTASLRQMISLDWTHILSPAMVNTARIGFSRTHGDNNKPFTAINPLASDTSLGITPGSESPILSVPGLTTMQGALGDPTYIDRVQNSYQVYDDAFFTRGSHTLKFGFAAERLQENFIALILNGKFSFPSLQGFLLNQPTSASTGNPFIAQELGQVQLTPGPNADRQSIFGFYFQDDWRVSRNLTLNLGLRYEPTTIPYASNHRFAYLEDFYNGVNTFGHSEQWATNQTLRNFAPRIGFAWDPFGDGKTAVRGGFGIFDVLPLVWQTTISNATEPPYLIQGSAGNLPAGVFPNGVLPLLSLPTSLNSRYVEPDPHTSYTMNWNLNVQRQVTSSLTLMVGYIGSRSVHLVFTGQDQDWVPPTVTPAGLLWPFPVGSGTRLNPNVATIHTTTWDSGAYYDGLQVRLTKRMSYGLQGQIAYTWSRCMDNGSSEAFENLYTNSIAGPAYFSREERYGPCDFNITQQLSLNYIWQLPTPKSGNAIVAHIVGGWEVGGIFSASTGTPFSLILGGDPLGTKATVDTPDFPDRVSAAGCGNPVNPGDANGYLKLNCFTPAVAPASLLGQCQPAAASVAASVPDTCMNLLGNLGRNQLVGPGLWNFDFSLFKNNYIPKISDNFNIQFRAELFNIFNHTNLQAPVDHATIFNQNGTPTAGAGVIDSTVTTARQIQFGLKMIW